MFAPSASSVVPHAVGRDRYQDVSRDFTPGAATWVLGDGGAGALTGYNVAH